MGYFVSLLHQLHYIIAVKRQKLFLALVGHFSHYFTARDARIYARDDYAAFRFTIISLFLITDELRSISLPDYDAFLCACRFL